MSPREAIETLAGSESWAHLGPERDPKAVLYGLLEQLETLRVALEEIAGARMYAGSTTYEPKPEEFYPTYGDLAASRAQSALNAVSYPASEPEA